jgi:hypothetical protein
MRLFIHEGHEESRRKQSVNESLPFELLMAAEIDEHADLEASGLEVVDQL